MNSKIVADFLGSLGTSDFESWVIVQRAYKDHAWAEQIFETGFNMSSGYVYIALENGVQICSCFGRDVEYCVFDFETGEEHFYDTYEEALNHVA
jgi:hypothetical protein